VKPPGDWPQIIWDVHLPDAEPRLIEMLDADGHWRTADAACERIGTNLRIQAAFGLSFRRPLILALRL